MRDSPNSKRFGHRDRQGRITEAYGFDLAPIAARHAEFLRLAAEERQERQEMARLRRRATIARKGITQILETAHDYGLQGEEWALLAQETRQLTRLLKDAVGPADMESGVVLAGTQANRGPRAPGSFAGTCGNRPQGAGKPTPQYNYNRIL